MQNIAFLILDLQNDICHKEGSFHKNGLDTNPCSKIIPNTVNMIFFCKEHFIPIIALQHTILEDPQKKALSTAFYKKTLPFIENEGLRFDSWGHDLLDEIKNVDYKIKRWTMSSFHNTELAKHLASLQINQLIIAGFTTNGIVETTAREAVSRNYKTTILSDCTTSYSESLHLTSLANLDNFAEIISSENYQKSYLQRQLIK